MIPVPDTNRLPAIGSPERSVMESEALDRAVELLHQNDGRLRDALDELEQELVGSSWNRRYPQTARDHARGLTDHVEQCWATAVARSHDRVSQNI